MQEHDGSSGAGAAGGHQTEDRLRLPGRTPTPARILLRRVLAAVALIVIVAVLVLLDAEGYDDVVDGEVGPLDAVYYATVAVTTTGYGDIAPVTPGARALTALIVTPIRVAFLILVVGTTVEVLTDRWREALRRSRWRDRMQDHFVICGYGTKGRAAAAALVGQGFARDRIVVVDASEHMVAHAQVDGFAGVVGDATRSAVLSEAGVDRARGVVVALDRDDTAVLATLTVRDLNADVAIAASAKEEENTRLLARSGADSVVTADEATGRLLGTALTQPSQVAFVEDLLSAGEGVELVETDHAGDGAGSARDDGVIVAVVRGGEVIPVGLDPEVRTGDRLIRLRCADRPESPGLG